MISHCADKTVIRSPYIHNGISYTGKMVCLYWITPLVSKPPGLWSFLHVITWWRHQMETFSALLALCVGNSPIPVNSPHKGQWRGALIFSFICTRINGWVNNGEAGDLRRKCAHYDRRYNITPFYFLSEQKNDTAIVKLHILSPT